MGLEKKNNIKIFELPKNLGDKIFQNNRDKLANEVNLSSLKRIREEIKERNKERKESNPLKPVLELVEEEKFKKEKEEVMDLFFGRTPGYIKAGDNEPDGHYNANMPDSALLPGSTNGYNRLLKD